MSLGPVMLDIEGLTLSPADRDLLREPAVGGLILFARNYESVEQLADLVSEVRALRSPPLLVAVDHEGGRGISAGSRPSPSRARATRRERARKYFFRYPPRSISSVKTK